MDRYPKRESHFAHKACRLAAKSCLAQQTSPTAALLFHHIALTEDARRYRGPVTFYTAQLLPILGVAKWKTLAAARESLVSAGWLHYQQGEPHQPGIYWAIVPADAAADDSPADEGAWPLEGYDRGHQEGYARGYQEGYDKGHQEGQHSNPVPKPSPAPKKRFEPEGKELPFDSAEFAAAWGEWCQARREQKKPLTPTVAHRQLLQLSDLGQRRALAALRHSVTCGYQGIFEPKTGNGSAGGGGRLGPAARGLSG